MSLFANPAGFWYNRLTWIPGGGRMALKYTEEKLNSFDKETLIQLFLSQQEQLENIDHNLQLVLEQLADLKRHRFGRSSERHESDEQISFMEVDGKIVFFNESEAVAAEDDGAEPETVPRRKPKKKQGKREEDLDGLPVVVIEHSMTEEELAKQREELNKIERNRPTSRSRYFGIVDLAGFPKDRYYLYKARWMPDTPMVHILPHWNFPDRVGKVTPVFVYSSGDEVELFLNGKSLGKKQKQPYEYRFRWDSVVYQSGELKAVAYKQHKKWAEARVQTTGDPVRLKAVPDKTLIKADGEDLVFVKVSLVDKDGYDVPTAENRIFCSLEGDGEIVATDNGDPTCLITFSEPSRPAFNGLFLAIVKAKRDGNKPLRLTIEADGLEKATVDIEIDHE